VLPSFRCPGSLKRMDDISSNPPKGDESAEPDGPFSSVPHLIVSCSLLTLYLLLILSTACLPLGLGSVSVSVLPDLLAKITVCSLIFTWVNFFDPSIEIRHGSLFYPY